MENRKIAVIVSVSVAFLLGATFVLQDSSKNENLPVDNDDDESESSSIESTSEGVSRTDDGTKFILNPDKLQQGCPSMDCIPSIDDPSYIGTGEAGWLNPDDRVIGLEINGDARAYPLRILNVHEIVNTRVGGEPIVVTYCPLCRSGVTYSREVGGVVLEFGVSGKLHNANLVMYDRQSETYWSQIEGKAIVGEKVPQELDLKFSSIVNWSDWREGHPDTKVLSRETGIYPVSTYDSNPYSGYSESSRVGFGVGEVDDRLDTKRIVFGITAGGVPKAYPEDEISSEGLIQDEVGGIPVAIFESPSDGSIVALIRESGGEETDLSIQGDRLVDSQGREWSFEGEQLNGGGSMQKLNPRGFFWFAWSKFHPGTEVYNS